MCWCPLWWRVAVCVKLSLCLIDLLRRFACLCKVLNLSKFGQEFPWFFIHTFYNYAQCWIKCNVHVLVHLMCFNIVHNSRGWRWKWEHVLRDWYLNNANWKLKYWISNNWPWIRYVNELFLFRNKTVSPVDSYRSYL